MDHSALIRRALRLASAFGPLPALPRNERYYGGHNQRQSGHGDDFWQLRPYSPGDDWTRIDWRKSGGSDIVYSRQNEWQTRQMFCLWCSPSPSLAYGSDPSRDDKIDRATLLLLAFAAVMLARRQAIRIAGKDKVFSHLRQLTNISLALAQSPSDLEPGMIVGIPVIADDIVCNLARVEDLLHQNGTCRQSRSGHGLWLCILDPAEVSMPLRGALYLHSPDRRDSLKVRKVEDLRKPYQRRLQYRLAKLNQLNQNHGWRFIKHISNHDPQNPLAAMINGIKSRASPLRQTVGDPALGGFNG